MSLWKRTMDYLGLGPDEAYYDDEFDEEYEPRQRRGDAASRPGPSADEDTEQSDNTGSGRPCSPVVILMPLLRDASHRAMIPE